MNAIPKTRWAKTVDGASIAYQAFGHGDLDLLVVHSWCSHIEVYWEQPRFRRFMDRLSRNLRVIHLDGRPHPGSSVQWLAGHSIGRWRGQTLVVDTTNFTERTNFRGSPQNTRQDIFATERLHVIERFTPSDANTIRYEFTVEDPDTWTVPWSGEMSIRRIEGPIYEYACHEGNYGLANILRGARVAEARTR
jgi:hypothetical protein